MTLESYDNNTRYDFKVYNGWIGLMLDAMIDQDALSREELDELY